MASWQFEELPAALVEQELTQRDQFNNDDVGLTDALVREAIQNSADAAQDGETVKVRFELRTLDERAARELAELFVSLRPHLRECHIPSTPLDQRSARVLAVEDFDTTGLTGSFDKLDDGHFRSFWRRHGTSGKAGKQGGRWGLGKLVFSTTSQVRAFFELTIRNLAEGPLLMGQAALRNHELDGRRYPAYGFWFDSRTSDGLQLPVTEDQTVRQLQTLFGFARTNQCGLSIAIPYITENVTEAAIIDAVVNNYYFPILSGRLTVEVGRTVIDKRSFAEIAHDQINSDKGVPLQFVTEVSNLLSHKPDVLASRQLGNVPLGDTLFESEELLELKKRFAAGEMVHVRIPVELRPKESQNIASFVDLFLKPLPEGARSFALYARGHITLIGERRYFGNAAALGALVARDEKIAEFLGDAENPAHTGWNSNAEKLAAKWRSPASTLSNIRHSLHRFYNLLAERIDTEHPDALIDFFSLADQGRQSQGKKKRRVAPPIPPPKPREKEIVIRPRKGGFELIGGPGARSWVYPRTIRVRIAYDIVGGNPFKLHHKFDFDLTNNSDIELTPDYAEAKPISKNVLELKTTSPEFKLEARGFDERRDVVVSARVSS